MTRDEREKLIWRHLLTSTLSTEDIVKELADLWQQQVEEAEEEGYDMAAQDITLKIQACIPDSARTIPDARVQGAWRDAGSIALNHLGRYKNRK